MYLAAADESGMMVSFIQSNYMGFGSGLVVPGTGIALQNRGAGFTLEEGHPNVVEGGKRPFHTIIPGFLSRDGEALCAFGVMGGDMQPQGHVQVLINMIDYRMNPQTALDAPRIKVLGGPKLAIEPGFGAEVARRLEELGHQVTIEFQAGTFGGGQIIWRDETTGAFIGGTEPRNDGAVVGW